VDASESAHEPPMPGASSTTAVPAAVPSDRTSTRVCGDALFVPPRSAAKSTPSPNATARPTPRVTRWASGSGTASVPSKVPSVDQSRVPPVAWRA
jgi:hypothetical protein